MQKTLIARASLLFVTAALFFGIYGVPATAQADTATCTSPSIGNFVPHIQNGHLDSFDYYIDDQSGTSYLPLFSTIGNTAIDLNYISVWHDFGPTRVKVHVDVPDEISLPADITVSVGTLQVTQGPPPICITTSEFHVKLPAAYTGHSAATQPTTPISSTPTAHASAPTATVKPTTTPAGTATATNTPVAETAGQCTTLATPWLVLLVLLDIVISLALLLFMSMITISNARLAVAVLLPPAVFIGVWYFLDSCHTDVWFPILAVILAIIVLTASGSPDLFEGYRVRIKRFFGRRTKDTQMRLAEATSIMEVK